MAKGSLLNLASAAQEGALPPGLDPALDEEGDEELDDDDSEAPAAADVKLPMKIGPKLTCAFLIARTGKMSDCAQGFLLQQVLLCAHGQATSVTYA